MTQPLQPQASLSVIRNLMARSKRAAEDLHNVTRSMLKPGVQISFKRGDKTYLAKIVGVIGSPGRTRLTVQKLDTLKKLDIQLEDIAGIVQE